MQKDAINSSRKSIFLHRPWFIILDTQYLHNSLSSTCKSQSRWSRAPSHILALPLIRRRRGIPPLQRQQIHQISNPLALLSSQIRAFRVAAMAAMVLQSENKLTQQWNWEKRNNGLPLQKGSSRNWRIPISVKELFLIPSVLENYGNTRTFWTWGPFSHGVTKLESEEVCYMMMASLSSMNGHLLLTKILSTFSKLFSKGNSFSLGLTIWIPHLLENIIRVRTLSFLRVTLFNDARHKFPWEKETAR